MIRNDSGRQLGATVRTRPWRKLLVLRRFLRTGAAYRMRAGLRCRFPVHKLIFLIFSAAPSSSPLTGLDLSEVVKSVLTMVEGVLISLTSAGIWLPSKGSV